jgi:protoporphyrinogen oxidase
MKRPIVIVGGGISALLAATLERRIDADAPIVVVEHSREVGGLLRKIDGGCFGSFDCGMHTMTETGIPELDTLFWQLLPDHKWHHFAGRDRDLSGVYFHGKLQHNAHHADLRHCDKSLYRDYLADFFLNIQHSAQSSASNMHDYARQRFGNLIAEKVVDPVVRKTFHLSPREVDPWAAKLIPLDRIVLFDEAPFIELMASPLLRERLAYPEQRKLKLEYSSGRGSYYPADYGIHRVIDALSDRLRRQNVQILTETHIAHMTRESGRIHAVLLKNKDGTQEIANLGRLYWTVGLPQLAKQAGVTLEGVEFDAPLQTVIVNFLFDRPPDTGDLYYFYSFDPSHSAFRITNYGNYCPGAARENGHPLCVEMLLDMPAATDKAACASLALNQLHDFGILPRGTRTLFSSSVALASGFPRLSCRNVCALERIRAAIDALEVTNLTTLGIFARPGLFFQTDVLIDTYRQIMERTFP